MSPCWNWWKNRGNIGDKNLTLIVHNNDFIIRNLLNIMLDWWSPYHVHGSSPNDGGEIGCLIVKY